MKLKTTEIDGTIYAMVQDGKPVYTDDSGKDIAFDAVHSADTIKRLNGEAKGHREAKEAAEKALKAFEGIDDPEAALKALSTVQNLDDKKLVDAGEVEKVKAEAIKAVEEKYKPTVERAEALEKQLRQEKIGGSFARSKFIADKLAVPAPMVEKTFGEHFTIEDGKIIAKDTNGNQIYSKERPGEPADFDEALETLVDNFPYRDSIVKGRGSNGSGAPGGGQGANGGKMIARAEFDKLAPEQRMKTIQDGVAVTE